MCISLAQLTFALIVALTSCLHIGQFIIAAAQFTQQTKMKKKNEIK